MQTSYSWFHPLFPQEDRYKGWCSEEESQDLSSKMLPSGLLVVHDASGGGQHHIAKLSGGQEVVGPLLDVSDGNIEPGRDHPALVEAPSQVDNNFAGSVVINDLKWIKIVIAVDTYGSNQQNYF